MSTELIDELEAGELAVEFEDAQPEDLLEWAVERFSPRLALSTAFQASDGVLLDMLYEIDPEIPVFTIDTGRLPEETFQLIEALRERYPRLNLDVLAPDPTQLRRMVSRHGPNLFCETDKYARIAHPSRLGVGNRTRIKQRFSPQGPLRSPAFPPKWRLDPAPAAAGRGLSTAVVRLDQPALPQVGDDEVVRV